MSSVKRTKECTLSALAATAEPCPGDTCAFWQNGGDDLEAGCAVERLGLDRSGIDVVDFLLGVRRQLESRA
jgi:hypothetical protein